MRRLILCLLLAPPLAHAGPAEDLARALDALPRERPARHTTAYRVLPETCEGTTATRCLQVYSLLEASILTYCSTVPRAPACTQKESPQ